MNKPLDHYPPDRSVRINQQQIKMFSKNHRIEYPIAEKVFWLSRVLHAISISPISKDFALIGGSAIVFLYRSMYRFSTDLDLDFVGNKDLGRGGKAEIRQRQEDDMNALKTVARNLGCNFKPKPQEDERFVQYEISYPSYYTRTGIVELDMSYRYCHSVLGLANLEWPISHDGLLPRFNVQSLKQEELYANKTLALIEAKERLDFPGKIGLMFKRKIRHLFDLYFLAEEALNDAAKIDLHLLHNLVVLFGMTRIENFMFFRGNAIGSYTKDDIKNELRSVVPKKVPIPSVDEMKWLVRKFFDLHIFNWSKREHEFAEDFKAKNFRPEKLFNARISKNLRGLYYYKDILGKVKTLE